MQNQDPYAELNPQQRDAVLSGDGPLLVVAGAGSGKTKTLAFRVARLISTGTDPDRIMLLTFTRRAAKEMLSRAAGALGKDSQLVSRGMGRHVPCHGKQAPAHVRQGDFPGARVHHH
jgi:DNA helicase-2/ATP-dependent DNA helicase PcrA